jgi:hypothetical protein
MNINEILSSISEEILSEEVKTQISDSFKTVLEEVSTEKAKVLLEAQEKEIDAKHAEMLKTLVEKIDADHTEKMKLVLETMDQEYGKKLSKVVEKYEQDINESAKAFKSEMIQKTASFIDLYIDKAIPQDHLKEAVENIKARRILEKVRDVVGLDTDFMSNEIKTAIKEGHEKIQELEQKVAESINESKTLKESLNGANASLFLVESTKSLPDEKASYLKKTFEGKGLKDIKENFKFVLEMYEKNEQDHIDSIKNKEQSKSKVLKEGLDMPKSVETPKVEGTKNSEMDVYLEALAR